MHISEVSEKQGAHGKHFALQFNRLGCRIVYPF